MGKKRITIRINKNFENEINMTRSIFDFNQTQAINYLMGIGILRARKRRMKE